MPKKSRVYDFIVVGAGVAGLAATMYGTRLGLKTLCLGANSGSDAAIGGNITSAEFVENYPGFINLKGSELAGRIRKHAESYKLAKISQERVEEVSKNKDGFLVRTDKNNYLGKTILFATGTKWKKLDIPGSADFEGKGVAYCALCDGPLFRNKIVAVVGGSDTAAKEALILAQHVKKVYIIYRGEQMRPEKANIEEVKANSKIEIINKTNIIEIKGKDSVNSVILDRAHKGSKEIKLEGVFVAIGHIPLSELTGRMGIKLNEKKEIITNHKTSETSLQGVYAAGDITDRQFKQAITGVAEGCTAAYSAFEHITNKG